MVTNTMANNTTTLAHIGSIKQSDGVLRIDIKTRQCVIARSDVPDLMNGSLVEIYDMRDILDTCGNPCTIGKAWITRSMKAIMLSIDGLRYVSPLSQVKKILIGERRYAHLAMIVEQPAPFFPTTGSPGAGCAEVTA